MQTQTSIEDLPDYIHPDLKDLQEDLDLVMDLWEGLRKGKIKNYIDQETEEPDDAYKRRLKRSKFDNYFTPTIKGYSGLLSNFKLSQDVAQSIVDNQDDIDGQGNDLIVFLNDADDAVLRDGCCGFLIDYPDTTDLAIVSPLQLVAANLRPLVSLINRCQMINWQFVVINGRQVLDLIVIKTSKLLRHGKYGLKSKTIYKVLERGSKDNGGFCNVTEFTIEETSNGKVATQEGGVLSLGSAEIPIVLYSTSDRNPLTTLPPFLNTANLNVKLLRKQSELDEVQHRINFPVPVREGAEGEFNSVSGKVEKPPMVLGCNSGIDLPIGGKFYFAEPTGGAITTTQADIASLLKAIDRVSLTFLGGSKEGSMTATEALLNTAQVTTTINTIARRKESVVESIFKWWIFYTKEPTGGTIAIDDSVIKTPITDQGAQMVIDAMQSGGVSYELGFAILDDRKWLPDGTDIEAEIAILRGLQFAEAVDAKA